MMAYYGDLLIFSSFVTSIISMILYILVWRGRERLLPLARNFFKLCSILITTTLGLLLYLIITHDFSVTYVFSYSSTDLPLGYLISTLWGGQEGTFLLWIFYVAIMGLVMIYTSKKFEFGNMVFLNLFIISILVILIKKSPFEIMPVFRAEGAGLNPLLQNFWMQIHPPIMFVGFAGALFPFLFGMTALVERKYDTWAESARRWTMFAWVTLGTSLVMGGYWAYVTLGWGGFWAWDPVENSSLIPWIFLAAQVHVLFIKRIRKGLMRFSLFMVCLTFWSVLYGTFLTRSGVLADFSVHSFVDLGINNFLIAGLFLFIIIGLSLLVWRWKDIRPNKSFSKVASRSYLLTLGIVTLFIGGGLTLLGTSAPLITKLTDNPSAVGLDYYFITMTPVGTVVMLLLGMFPAFRWNKGLSKPKLLIIGFSSMAITALVLFLTGFTSSPIYLFFFGAGAMAIVSNSYVLYESARNKSFVPGYMAHIGLALTLIGAGVSAGFESKKTIKLPMNQQIESMGYQLKFVSMIDNPKGFDCHVEISNNSDNFVAVLPHEFPKNQEGVMRQPHVKKYWWYDVYVAPVAMENPNDGDKSIITFEKGETKSFDKYSFTFHNFELTSHDEEGPATAVANLTVSYDGQTEDVSPLITVDGDAVSTEPAPFDYNNAAVVIAGIDPDSGSLIVRVLGSFIGSSYTQNATLVIELSEKPLINLFWFGTSLCFLSGALSMYNRKRRVNAETVSVDPELSKKEIAS
jgi:cytochrome c-type biogenesis protein CcmF